MRSSKLVRNVPEHVFFILKKLPSVQSGCRPNLCDIAELNLSARITDGCMNLGKLLYHSKP